MYDVQGQLHVKADDKKTWKKLDCVLQTTGLCYTAATSAGGGAGKQARHADVTCLQSLGEVDIYLGVDWRKKYKAPTEHGIALKVRIDCRAHLKTGLITKNMLTIILGYDVGFRYVDKTNLR